MKIAICAGSYDPTTAGHVWLVEQACKIADEVHALIGPNPFKKYLFSESERIAMLRDSVAHTKATAHVLKHPTVVHYCHDLVQQKNINYSEVCFVRGVRDTKDLIYEQGIERCMRSKEPLLNFVYFSPPDNLKGVRSSVVKDLCLNDGAEEIEQAVPEPVFQKMKQLVKNDTFNPEECWSACDGEIENFDVPGSQFILFGKMKRFFSQAVSNGFFKFAEEVDASQVRAMLDPVPIDLVVSDKFKLMEVKTSELKPTGKQYLPCSQSLGPIIVEANEVLPLHPQFNVKGNVIIIEGKHRWIEAMERCDPTILAWVGSRAIPHLSQFHQSQ